MAPENGPCQAVTDKCPDYLTWADWGDCLERTGRVSMNDEMKPQTLARRAEDILPVRVRAGARSIGVKRLLATAAVAGVALAGAGMPAHADSVHLKGGAHSAPTFRDNGLTLTASGALAGLGNQDLVVNLTATGNPIAVCVNPSVRNGKDNEPPGQNPAPVTLTANPEAIPASEIKNGNVSFGLTTNPPTNNPIPGAPDCPNHLWNEVIRDIRFTS